MLVQAGPSAASALDAPHGRWTIRFRSERFRQYTEPSRHAVGTELFRLGILQRYNGVKPLLLAYHTRDMALAR